MYTFAVRMEAASQLTTKVSLDQHRSEKMRSQV